MQEEECSEYVEKECSTEYTEQCQESYEDQCHTVQVTICVIVMVLHAEASPSSISSSTYPHRARFQVGNTLCVPFIVPVL